jgi:hypothetical protein
MASGYDRFGVLDSDRSDLRAILRRDRNVVKIKRVIELSEPILVPEVESSPQRTATAKYSV